MSFVLNHGPAALVARTLLIFFLLLFFCHYYAKKYLKKKTFVPFRVFEQWGNRGKNLEPSSWKSAEKRDGRAFDAQTAAVGIAGRLEAT